VTIADDVLRAALDDRIAALRTIAADPSGYDAPVAACPGWTVADLLVHLAIIHGWAGEIVATGATERPRRPKGLPEGTPLADWVTERSTILTEALATADLDAEVYTFVGVGTVRWWLRRQAHETIVHTWDAQAALGTPDTIAPALAADGVDELLTVFVPALFDTAAFGADGQSIHFHATDAEGEWLLRFADGGLIVSGEHAKGDVAARGPAEQLLLVGWKRAPVTAIEAFGDTALLERFLTSAAF
jgi:uncharacterized protein (TIGR03083 family)